MYEVSSEVCESITTLRTSYLGFERHGSAELEVAFHDYSLDVVETTSLSCCLAAEDYSENINACDEVTINIDEYSFD